MNKQLSELILMIFKIKEPEILEKLFTEIFTTKELSDVSLRWQLLKELKSGKTQRAIAADHKISLCKITRGSKLLKDEQSIVNTLLNTYMEEAYEQ